MMTGPLVLFWGGLSSPQSMSSVGNPFVWWFSFASLILFGILASIAAIYGIVQYCRPRDTR